MLKSKDLGTITTNDKPQPTATEIQDKLKATNTIIDSTQIQVTSISTTYSATIEAKRSSSNKYKGTARVTHTLDTNKLHPCLVDKNEMVQF